MIYLDYSAHTPADGRVLERFLSVERRFTGNPNSRHPMGLAAAEELSRVTESVAKIMDCLPAEVIFTSGASEANNLAVKGIARASRHIGRHVISTGLEHPSVSGALTALKDEGYEVDLVGINRDGRIDLDELRGLLRRDTVLVAVTLVDSELGTVQDIDALQEILKAYPDCRLHLDATQAVGKIPVTFTGDTMTFAPHKFYGLCGSGVLLKRRGLVIEPMIHGGSGVSEYRSGTPALGLAAALEEALRLATDGLFERRAAVKERSERLKAALNAYPGVRINSPEGAVPHILNLSVDGVKGTAMQAALADRGVCVSVKSACQTEGTPSRAVYAVSRDRKNALSSFRISLSHLTTAEELEEFIKIFDDVLRELR